MSETSNPACRALIQQVSAYLDGELDAVECASIEQHCATCTSCATMIEGLRRTVALCREAGATPVPDAVRARARASVRRLLSDEA